jgi:hypothetical protein
VISLTPQIAANPPPPPALVTPPERGDVRAEASAATAPANAAPTAVQPFVDPDSTLSAPSEVVTAVPTSPPLVRMPEAAARSGELHSAAPRPRETMQSPAPVTAAAPRKLAALPPSSEDPRAAAPAQDRPSIMVLRGGRQNTPTQKVQTTAPRRLAALPQPSDAARTATDAPPIIVLRGRPSRYAQAGLVQPPQSAAQPLLTVIRGARPRPTGLEGLVQPGPLILHLPNR